MKILLADDSDLMLDRLMEMLSKYPQVEVVAALKNGSEILETVKRSKPHLAILDLRMPGLNGLDVLKALRKENLYVRIIILTFFATDNYRLVAKLLGADYFFSKVDDFDQVEQVVLSLLQKEELNQKLRCKEMTVIRTRFHQQYIHIDLHLQSKSQ
ncbi:MAG: response regulator transcription factor [Bacteroidales bacterium]